MKNIHVLPTDKPSRLSIDNDINELVYGILSIDNIPNCKNQNIYITSDEEIKEGWKGYAYKEDVTGKVFKHFYTTNEWYKDAKKIILTTDQDLIKDGVQAIDDEFLEWFVKNPSCETAEVVSNYRVKSGNIEEHKQGVAGYEYYEYKIIIPKEEPNRTHYLDELPNIDKKILSKMWEDVVPELEPKQEKLEETIGLKAHEYSMQYVGTDKYTVSMLAIEFGYHLALEQEQEKSYSEEDMHNLMDEYQNWLFNTNTVVLTFREWFKQFKKK